MTLNKALILFESLTSETHRKSEIKVYQEFIQIITSLENRNLSESEIQSIEKELTRLDLESNPKNRKKYYRSTLTQFKKFLKAVFSLISKGYYTAIGMSLGMCFGVAFGSLIDRITGVSSGLVIGMFIGLLFGRHMDNQAMVEGKVL